MALCARRADCRLRVDRGHVRTPRPCIRRHRVRTTDPSGACWQRTTVRRGGRRFRELAQGDIPGTGDHPGPRLPVRDLQSGRSPGAAAALRRRLATGHVAGTPGRATAIRAGIPDAPLQSRRRGRVASANDGPGPHGTQHGPCQRRHPAQPAPVLGRSHRRRRPRPRCPGRDAHGEVGRAAPVGGLPCDRSSRPLDQPPGTNRPRASL